MLNLFSWVKLANGLAARKRLTLNTPGNRDIFYKTKLRFRSQKSDVFDCSKHLLSTDNLINAIENVVCVFAIGNGFDIYIYIYIYGA